MKYRASTLFAVMTLFAALAITLLLAASALAQAPETVLYTFPGGTHGAVGGTQLVSDTAGNLYGTTFSGGNNSTSCETATGVPGCGVVFKLTLGAHGSWKETVLYTFTGGKDGAIPSGGVILDSAGNLYGTASFGGNKRPANCRLESVPGCGVVFKLSPQTGNGRKPCSTPSPGAGTGANPLLGLPSTRQEISTARPPAAAILIVKEERPTDAVSPSS